MAMVPDYKMTVHKVSDLQCINSIEIFVSLIQMFYSKHDFYQSRRPALISILNVQILHCYNVL